MSNRADLVESLDRALWTADARAAVLLQAIAERVGLHSTDLECLTILVHGGALTAGQLAERLGLSTGAATRLIDRLAQSGYVRRSTDPFDRRRVIVEVEPDRVQSIIALHAPMSQALARIAEQFDDATLQAIVAFLAASHEAMQQQILRLREPAPEAGTTEVTVPLTRHDLKLLITSGARFLTIAADRSIADAFRGRFEGATPKVELRHDTVSVKFGGALLPWRSSMARIGLNPAVAWHLLVRNGISKCDADLRDLSIRSVEIRNGISDATITLPMPRGTVPVRIRDGISNLTIRRPADAATRIHLAGGASNVTLDGDRVMGNDLHWETPGYASATDRYEMVVQGGASNVAFDTR